MINYEVRFGDKIFSFNRILTESELILTENELINLDCYIGQKDFQINIRLFDYKEMYEMFYEYQNRYYDELGMLSLLNIKNELNLIPVKSTEVLLAIEMILSAERWINKLWGIFAYYKINIDYLDRDIYSNIQILEPIARFYDVLWTLNINNYRMLEPNRDVNTDISYYSSFNP